MQGVEEPTERSPLPDPFRVEVRPDRERVVVAPRGELDVATAGQLAAEIEELVARGFDAIVLDLRGTSFIDSTGVHLLVRQARRPDAQVTLIDGSPLVRRIIDLCGIRDDLRFEPAP